MKKLSLFLSLLLIAAMMSGLIVPAIAETTETVVAEEEATPEPEKRELAEDGSMPLVVAYTNFNGKFSPFFWETGYDLDAESMTQLGLMVTDRTNAIVYNGIEGETRSYNGQDFEYKGIADLKVERDDVADTTTYTATLRDGIVFSDGVPMTIDDVIFSYYVLLDTAFSGASTLNSQPIIGLAAYRNQMSDDALETLTAQIDGIFAAGEDHAWVEGDGWTKEQQDFFWTTLAEIWTGDVQAIIDYVFANYLSYAPERVGKSEDEVTASEGLKVALGMSLWGFGAVDKETGVLTGAVTGKTWTLVDDDLPTAADYYAETKAAYGGDPVEYYEVEAAPTDTTDVWGTTRDLYFSTYKATVEGGAAAVTSIAGIKRVDDHTVSVTTNGFSAAAVYSILGIQVAPLHYYGDPAQYDYENGQYGFPRGDLSIPESKTANPLGAGAYKFIKYENKVVYFEANELFWKGVPKIKYVQFKETLSADVAPGVKTGIIDSGEMSGSVENFAQVSSFNSNGELNGDTVTVSLVNNFGYGYLGISAGLVNVGGDPGSAASKALRKGFATVLAVYRDTAIDSYYGEVATVIQYPISNTSWAAPLPTDEGYEAAFAKDVDGNPIYTAGQTTEERYAAALEAAKGFFIAAGYTWDEASGKFTAAPEGASLTYPATVGDPGGDHPSFGMVTDASAALATIGIDMPIRLIDWNVQMEEMNADQVAIWVAAWGAGTDPDLYQVYHSSNRVGQGGTDSNHYGINDPTLDQLILDARVSPDQAYRKAVYKLCFDVILDWGVELPVYQRQNAILLSTERINISTITPEVTSYWGWLNDVELLEMNAVAK